MALYKCDSCNELRDEPVCTKCGADTRPVQSSEASLEEVAAALERAAGVPPAPTARPARPQVAQQPQPAPVVAAPRQDIRGLDEFHALLDRGVKAVVVCGGPRAGKSEIAAGFIRAQNVYRGVAQFLTLRATLRTDYSLGGTVEGEVWYQIIDGQRTFLDPSGEFFNRLSAEHRQKFGLPDITEEDFRFVQRAVQSLAGVVLVFDLTRAVDPRDRVAWRQQENDFNFILAALRWLRWDREARPPQLGLSVNIAQRVKTLPKLDKPVLVLFSKGDQLPKFTNQIPLTFAKQRLPVLHGAVMTHARRFRYDFCHTMTRVNGEDRAVDRPCGVLLPIEWLLDERFRWLPWQLPTTMLGGGK